MSSRKRLPESFVLKDTIGKINSTVSAKVNGLRNVIPTLITSKNLFENRFKQKKKMQTTEV